MNENQELNEDALISFYKKWYEEKYINSDLTDKTTPLLLNTKYKCDIMLFGQEANDICNNCSKISFNELYNQVLTSADNYWNKILNYDFFIRYTKGGNKVKTRKLGNFEYFHLYLAQIDTAMRMKLDKSQKESDDLKIAFNRVLINNMNKFSSNGKNTSINEATKLSFDKIDGMTIFQKEIEYFKPKIIIFACGPRYVEQINLAFNIKIEKTDIPHAVTGSYLKDISKYFDKINPQITALYTVHPQRTLSELKKEFENEAVGDKLKQGAYI
jgi:hypothetical protein